MKRIFLITFLFLLLATGSAAKAFAVQTVSFSLPEVQCAPNRLIQVPCVATGSGKFCAGTFSFQFDKNLLEIRKVTPYKGAKAVFHQADTLKISYVHPDGIDLSAAPEIFTLQFKVKGEGTTPISFEVYDCVDSDVEFMQIGTCISGSVTAENGSKTTGGASAEQKGKQTGSAQSSVRSGAKSGSSAKSQTSGKAEKETTRPTVPITEEKHDSNGNQAVAIAVLTVSVVGGMIFFSWFIPKMIKDYQSKKKPPAEETSGDNDRK